MKIENDDERTIYENFFQPRGSSETFFLVDIEKDIFSRRKGWFFERTRLKNATKRRNKKEKNN